MSRKVACVVVDHLAVEVERSSQSELRARPVVVGGLPHERRLVFDASAEAARAGVRRGMPLRQAHQLCPDAAFLPLNEDGYRRVHGELLCLLEQFSPAVEPLGLDGAYLDVVGLTLLFGEDPVLAARIVGAIRRRLGLAARVGVGPGKLVARLAARLAGDGPVIVTPSEARQFLAGQPVSLLPLGPEAQTRLHRLGIRTIGQLARLPVQDLAHQLGAAGPAAHRLARGEDDSPIVPRPKPPAFKSAHELEPALTDLEQIRSLLEHLLGGLVRRLQAEARSCRALALRLETEAGERLERTAQLRESTDGAGALIRAAERLLAEIEPVEGVARVEVELTGLGASPTRQLGLFDAQRQRRDGLDRAVHRIQRRFGNRVKRVVVADEGAWIPSRRFVLRDY